MLVQRSYRQPFEADPSLPVKLDPLSERAWRFLRAFFTLSSGGLTGVYPAIRHLGSGGQILGEWVGCEPGSGGAAIGNGTPGKVCMSTAPAPVALDRPQGPAGVVVCHISVPSDLVILSNETLEVQLLGATVGSGQPVVTSEVFFTIAIEP